MIMSGMEAAVIDDPITKMMNLMSPMLLCRFDPSFSSSFFFLGVLSRMSSRRISHPLWVLLLLCKDEPLITAVPILPLMTKFTSKEYHTLLHIRRCFDKIYYTPLATIFSCKRQSVVTMSCLPTDTWNGLLTDLPCMQKLKRQELRKL